MEKTYKDATHSNANGQQIMAEEIEDCIVIGDSLNDFKAANAAGMKSIAFVGAEGNNTVDYRKKCLDFGVMAVCSTMKDVKHVLNNFANMTSLLNVKENFSR